MVVTKWRTEYSLGDSDIDDEHKVLFDLANRVSQSNANRSLNLCEALAELMTHISEHFHCEEALLKRIGYPRLAEHRRLHSDFGNDLVTLADRIHTATYSDCDDFTCLLITWMQSHVLGADMIFAGTFTRIKPPT